MSIFKCKMCGGTIEFNPGDTVGVCDSCGTKQTLPTTNDEIITNLHNRANTLRLKCEFDKAEEIYNKILEKIPMMPKRIGASFSANTVLNMSKTPKPIIGFRLATVLLLMQYLLMRITKRRSQTAMALSVSCMRRKRRRLTASKGIFSA